MQGHARSYRKFLSFFCCFVSAVTFCSTSIASDLQKVEYPYDTDVVSRVSIFLTNLYGNKIRDAYYSQVSNKKTFPCKFERFETTCVTIKTLSSVDVSGTGRFLRDPFPIFLYKLGPRTSNFNDKITWIKSYIVTQSTQSAYLSDSVSESLDGFPYTFVKADSVRGGEEIYSFWLKLSGLKIAACQEDCMVLLRGRAKNKRGIFYTRALNYCVIDMIRDNVPSVPKDCVMVAFDDQNGVHYVAAAISNVVPPIGGNPNEIEIDCSTSPKASIEETVQLFNQQAIAFKNNFGDERSTIQIVPKIDSDKRLLVYLRRPIGISHIITTKFDSLEFKMNLDKVSPSSFSITFNGGLSFVNREDSLMLMTPDETQRYETKMLDQLTQGKRLSCHEL